MAAAMGAMTRVVVVHDRRPGTRTLAECMERTLVRLGCHAMVIDLTKTPLADEPTGDASVAAKVVAQTFRPHMVFLCGAVPPAQVPWDFPTIVVSDAPEVVGETDRLFLDADADAAEIDARVAETLNCVGGATRVASTESRIRTVLVSGYFGAGNRGDDVIVATLLEAIDELPGTRIVLASPLPHRAIADYGRPAFDRLDPYECNRWASIASAVLLGPGGLWDDYSIDSVGGLAGAISGAARSPAHLVQLPILVKGHGGRFRGVGLGAGPLRDQESRAAVRLSVELSDQVSVRDWESRDLLATIAPELSERIDESPDFAWAMTLPENQGPTDLPWLPDIPWLVFNARPWGDNNRAQQQMWNETCAVAMEAGLAVVCVPMQDQDAELMRSLETPEEVHINHMPTTATHSEFIRTLAGAEAVVAMRLHASLLGHLTRTPGVGVSYHPKVASHYADVDRGDYVVEVDFAPGDVASRVRRALEQGIDTCHAERIGERRRAAEESLEHLRAYLDGLPGAMIGKTWNSMPPPEQRRRTLGLAGTLIPLEGCGVSGRNLLSTGRQVPVESRLTDEGGLVIAMTDRAPLRGDMVETVVDIPTTTGGPYRVSLHLQPLCQESRKLTGRIVHEVLIEDTLVLAMDCAEWKPLTSLWIVAVAKADGTSMTVRTQALKDCENWGWGASSSLTVEAVTIAPWGGQGEHTSSSNPFAVTAPPPS